MSLPFNNTAVCSPSGPFCGGPAWLQAKTGVASSIWTSHGFFSVQHMGLSWWLQRTVWGSTGAGNCIESYSVKQGPRRICQSLESHWYVFPWLISIPFSALSAWNHLFCKQNRKSRSFRLCHSLEWKQAHRVTASGCMWRIFSGKTTWQVPCLLPPLWCRIKGRSANSDCAAFKIKTSGYKIKEVNQGLYLAFPLLHEKEELDLAVFHITLSFGVFTCRIFHCPF